MSFDPKTLRLFISVIEHGTISSAAQAEHIATAALSRRVSELENQLNVNLIQRSNKGIKVTPAGMDFYKAAKKLLIEFDNISDSMKIHSQGLSGFVRVRATPSAIIQFLAREIADFGKKHPAHKVELIESISSAIITEVNDGSADIGVFTDGVPTGELLVIPYKSDRLYVVTSKNHPLASKTSVSFRDTLEFNYIGLVANSYYNLQLTSQAREFGLELDIKYMLSSYEAMCLMIDSDAGIGLVPEIIALKFSKIHDLHILKLEESWSTREISLCLNQINKPNESTIKLLQFLLKKEDEFTFTSFNSF